MGPQFEREFLRQAKAVAMASLDLNGCFLHIEQGRDHDSVHLLSIQCASSHTLDRLQGAASEGTESQVMRSRLQALPTAKS